MTKIYGRQRTHLSLSGKALEFYSGTFPLTIVEHDTDDGYMYTIQEPEWNLSRPVSEDQLVRILEAEAEAYEEEGC